jgi:thiamine biosynthesis lipoprotein
LRAALVAAPLAALLGCASAAPPEDPARVCPVTVSDGRYLMGTVLEISLCVPDRARGEALLGELFAEVALLEHMLSRFDVKSDLSKLNRAAGSGALRVAKPLAELTELSMGYTNLTRGAFDVTVGPLVILWLEAERTQELPGAADLAASRARVGPGVLRVDVAASSIELLTPGAMLDFGGVAKGWTLDRLARKLREAGVSRALLAFGQSSLCALGKPAGWDGWGVLLGDAAGGFAGTAQLVDQSLSISGSLGQYTEIAGRRYGHVIDPRSGEPLTRARVAGALAADGARAEALSKALLILGETEGIALLESLPDAEGILIDESGESWQTSGWTRAVRYSAEWPGEDGVDPTYRGR